MGINTDLLHPGSDTSYAYGATLPPISQVNAFIYESSQDIERVFENKAPGYAYTRSANPTVSALESRINELEGGIGAAACASGMAAVSLALMNILSAGDEVIAASGLYGGTLDLFRDLEAFGIHVVYTRRADPESLEGLITDKTRAVFAEVIENPGLYVLDIKKTADFLHERKIPLVVDSTLATPLLVKPIEYGADIVVHSTSKYINGSSNSIGGIIVDGGKFSWDTARYPGFSEWKKYGPFAYISKLRNTVWRNIGGCMSPMNAYLSVIGLETLGLRMERCCENANALAQALCEEEGIQVNYPLLADEEQRELVRTQMNGYGGAILTIRTGSKEQAFDLIHSLKYAAIASNIGDVRTLVIHPGSTLYVHSDEKEKEAAGVYPGTIRVSVGLEDACDLIDDFRSAVRTVCR